MNQEPMNADRAHAEHGSETARADPASVLRHAWSQISLRKLQQIVTETITLLNEAEPDELLGSARYEQKAGCSEDPIAEALEACRAELREECGMQDSLEDRAEHCKLVCRCMAEHAGWADVFREAFQKYHELAGRLLREALRDRLGDAVQTHP